MTAARFSSRLRRAYVTVARAKTGLEGCGWCCRAQHFGIIYIDTPPVYPAGTVKAFDTFRRTFGHGA
jgi:hypothetical protein